MRFDAIGVKYVRNITRADLQPSARLNLIVGPNASGKTALLEAIYVLSRARSFRTPRIKDVIQHQQQALQVTAQIGSIVTGIEKSYGSTIIKHNGEALKTVSEQAGNIPLLLITPDSHNLVTGPPKQRRHWLDWALFHVEPTYINVWRRYQKALRNRNTLLKNGGSNNQIDSWEKGMGEAASALNELREKFVIRLQQQLLNKLEGVFVSNPTVSFRRGCPDDISFDEYLKEGRNKDRLLGHTRYGPHKADINFLVDERLLSCTFSRGQIKRFVAVLLLAQACAYESIKGEKPVFLIDDFTAELDARARSEVLNSLLDYGGQIFLTSTEAEHALLNIEQASLFHVEHGIINKVIK